MTRQRGWDIVTGPGITALGIAAARGVESSRPDALIDDPFALAFARAVDSPVPFPLRWPEPGEPVSDRQAQTLHTSRFIGVRSRFYDDVVQDALRAGTRQVVLFAAGLDTRAYRLAWPAEATVYELDQPRVLAFKNEVLHRERARPRCRRVTVGIDLRNDWEAALAAGGFSPDAPTVWVAEGLLGYLSPDAEKKLLERVTACSAPGSRLALDRFGSLAAVTADLERLRARSGLDASSLFNLEPRPHPVQWLRPHGWTVREDDDATVARRYDRDLTDPFTGQDSRPWQDTRFLTAELARA